MFTHCQPPQAAPIWAPFASQGPHGAVALAAAGSTESFGRAVAAVQGHHVQLQMFSNHSNASDTSKNRSRSNGGNEVKALRTRATNNENVEFEASRKLDNGL